MPTAPVEPALYDLLHFAGLRQGRSWTVLRGEERLAPVLASWQGRPVPLHAIHPENRRIAVRVRAFVGFLAGKAKGEVDLLVGKPFPT